MAAPARLSIVTLGVADVASATRFYESLGWTRSPSSQDSITFFALAGSVLALYQREALADDAQVPADGDGFRGVTCALNCDSRDEVDRVFEEWVAAGAAAVVDPHPAFWGGYSSYVADPDGHLWEIAHNPYVGFDDQGRLLIS